jgi:hypothetical protein
MPEQTVTVTIPAAIFDHFKRRAEAGNRTVQDEIVAVLRAAVPVNDALSTELAEAIAPLALMTDDELWRSARSCLSSEEAAELEALHHKRGRDGLSPDEERTAATLLRRYERLMLVRAQAAALLKQLGHDVAALLQAS